MIDPKRQVWITTTQPAADAVRSIIGVQVFAGVDVPWEQLSGCRVVIWPTNSALGLIAGRANCQAAFDAGASEVKAIGVGDLGDGWDAASAAQEGWDKPRLLAWLKTRAQPWEPMVEPEPEVDWDTGPAPEPPRLLEAPAMRDTGWNTDLSWEEKWNFLNIKHSKGSPTCNMASALKVLNSHPNLDGMLWHDDFLNRCMRIDQKTRRPREWSDNDDAELLNFMQENVGLSKIKIADVRLAVLSVASRNRKNSAQEWLRSLKWDGTERIAAFFSDVFGAHETPYVRSVGRNFWVSMVARVMRPGCKVDTMVILEGSQGFGKSSALRAIGGDWYTVQHESVTGKGFFEVLQGKMLVEIAEMDAFGKADVTRIKQVVSTEVDRFRPAYGRSAVDHYRTSVFAGSTNKDDWNRDETGARRFWPIRCRGKADMEYVKRSRDQLFAEAYAMFSLGEGDARGRWWEMPEEETKAEQDARREDDSWIQPADEWLAGKVRTTMGEVLWGAIKMPLADQHTPQQKRMASVLRRLGWTNKHRAKGNTWFRDGVNQDEGSAD